MNTPGTSSRRGSVRAASLPPSGRILVACEYSGRVRDAFRARGFDAVSCDLLPSEAPGPHIQGDVTAMLREPWAMVIAHPPCTYLANSGVRWRVERQEWDEVREAAEFFTACLNANAKYVAVENPVMHSYGREAIGGLRPSFSIQPWQCGDPAKKRTCFWTENLPALNPTSDMTAADARADCHLAPPSADRWKERSRTYPGIAAAIADQWGGLLHRGGGMTCISTTALALFLNLITVPVTATDTGLIVHATDGPVEYVRVSGGWCWEVPG